MSVSCDCGFGADDYDWFYQAGKDFIPLATSKRKRCYSCLNLIDIGADVLTMACYRPPRTEIEERIYGEGGEIEMADKHLCEECGGLYMAIVELGYCISLTKGERMRDLVKQLGE